MHPALVLTQGDPEGIGPELLLRLGDAGLLRPGDHVVAGLAHLGRLRAELAAGWADRGLDALRPYLVPGLPAELSQVQALERGVDLVLEEAPARALVTAPIDKARCRAEGFLYPGHTEYLAARAGVDDFAMLMAGDRLRVVLATIHLPLREVPDALTPAAITRAARLLALGLRRHFSINAPKIGVLGLNPHAGERGLLGAEESTVITPAIHQLRAWAAEAGEPCTFEGPLAADTAFPWHASGRYHGLVAMYHDQGLAPFKLMHMHDGVNMTLGLPFVRTSPDHGTARDIAGRGVADPSSFFAAVAYARGEAHRQAAS